MKPLAGKLKARSALFYGRPFSGMVLFHDWPEDSGVILPWPEAPIPRSFRAAVEDYGLMMAFNGSAAGL